MKKYFTKRNYQNLTRTNFIRNINPLSYGFFLNSDRSNYFAVNNVLKIREYL